MHHAKVFSIVLLAVVACKSDKPASKQPPVGSSTPSDASAPTTGSNGSNAPTASTTLDESKLAPLMRFSKDDLDPSKPPCTDFAAHVNAKWLAANAIPSDRTTWGGFEMVAERSISVQRQVAEQAAAAADATGVRKIVGDLWATGMDEAKIDAQGIKPLESRLADIDKLTDAASVATLLRTAHGRGESLVFDMGPSPDFKKSDVNIAYVTQGGLGLPDRDYYFDKDKQGKRDAYVTHVAKVLELSGLPADAAAAGAKDVLAFETQLAKVSKSTEQLSRDVSLYYNPVTPADADKLTPEFPWSKFFESQGITVQTFSLAVPAFHQEFSKMLRETPVAQWKTYLRFHTVNSYSPYLGAAFQEASFNFYNKALRGQKEIKPRWKRVLDTINEQAGQALGQLYVQAAFPPESKARMQTLVENLRVALKARLEKLTWMSPETKTKAIAKWETFYPKIGYPEKWRDYSALATGRDSFAANVLAAIEHNYKWSLSKIGKPIDRAEWSGLDPQIVNANYNPLRNEITFPAAILQPPFFDPKADDATNYGGIGAVIGHEMIHGYDDQGSRFGPSGAFENWWSKADSTAFGALTEKLVAQYAAYEAAPGKKVNGKLTLGENIADLGGLAVAFDAMKQATAATPDPKTDGFTREQRFFYSWGTIWRRSFTPDELDMRLNTDSHAPANFRASGPLSNFTAFAEAFQCKPGDPMVRDKTKQLVIW